MNMYMCIDELGKFRALKNAPKIFILMIFFLLRQKVIFDKVGFINNILYNV
jgi:hypothetical protein